MSALEIVAALLGVINVVLVARRNILNYPFGIVMVVLYAKIFFDARLYSDAILQAYFLVVQLYGWWQWRQGVVADGQVKVEVLTLTQRATVVFGTVAASLTVGWLMSTMTNAAAPWMDAAVAGMSIVAQWLLSIRKLESWVLWIAVDVLAVGLFASRGLYPTAILYLIFLGLAVWGLLSWRRAMLDQRSGLQT